MMLPVLVTRFPARALRLLMMFCRSRKYIYTTCSLFYDKGLQGAAGQV